MNIRGQSLSPVLVVLAALMVLIETCYFASLRPGYNHVSNTISELGETGAPRARQVAFGFFLPVGLLVWLALWLVHREASDQHLSLVLTAMSCLGTGYALSAIFPCDPGGPLFGTWRTLIHNFLGLIDYGGTGFGFLLLSRHFYERNAQFSFIAFLIAGVLVLISLAQMASESALHIRGAVQRIAEVVQFAGVFYLCYLLSRKMTLGTVPQPVAAASCDKPNIL
jgi:hypothetical protein